MNARDKRDVLGELLRSQPHRRMGPPIGRPLVTEVSQVPLVLTQISIHGQSTRATDHDRVWCLHSDQCAHLDGPPNGRPNGRTSSHGGYNVPDSGAIAPQDRVRIPRLQFVAHVLVILGTVRHRTKPTRTAPHRAAPTNTFRLSACTTRNESSRRGNRNGSADRNTPDHG